MFNYIQPEANTLGLMRILLFCNLLISPSLCIDLLQETDRIKMQLALIHQLPPSMLR